MFLKVLLLLIRMLAEGGHRGEGVAEVGELLVVAKCNVIKYTSLLFIRHKRHREAGGDPFSCAARFIATQLALGIQSGHHKQ